MFNIIIEFQKLNKTMKDSLGDRMKTYYENRTRISLPRRTYTIIRIDGKAFHSFTSRFQKPFDLELISMMNETAIELCKEIQGAKFAFIQSDEISILLTDFDNLDTQAWFDGNIQKMASVSASIATAKFNMEYIKNLSWGKELYSYPSKLAHFDSRVFTIPTITEVENYFIWRQQDWTRNSISAVAQSLYSPKELLGKNVNEMQEMIFQKGINWNNYDNYLKRGRIIMKRQYQIENLIRTEWYTNDQIPIFTQDREFINNLIPKNI